MPRNWSGITALAIPSLFITSVSASAGDPTASLKQGNPQIKSAGPLGFGPEGILFVGDTQGSALYAIARGRVRISRSLAGGEEALAILSPGEIFGEMAILDPSASGRSADARAHEEDAILLELSRSRFEGLERADPDGCADLSALLCKLAARRCVETAERLARWRIMAGPA